MDSPIRLLIVAADPLVRSTLAILFEDSTNCEVIYSTSPAMLFSANLEERSQSEADLVIWDFGWESGNMEGLDFQDLDLPVISLVTNNDQAVEAWNAGTSAVLSREAAVDTLLTALKAAANGLVVLDPALTSSLLPSPPRLPDDLERAPTPREFEVLQLLAEGLTNRAIAIKLDISEHTVKFHVNAILNKLDAQSRTEAVVTATKLGFIVL
jgi:DNA-binding NarL/FixJ family response regulator